MFKRILIAVVALALMPGLLFAAPPPPNKTYHGTPMQGSWTITYAYPGTHEWVYSYQATGDILGIFNSAGEFRVSKTTNDVRFFDTGRNVQAVGTINPADNSMVIWIPIQVGLTKPHWEYLR